MNENGEESRDTVDTGAAGCESKAAGRILVVDDSRLSALKLVKAMRALGHEAESVSNGVEALRRLGEMPFDVVLLDIVMPEMDGYEVLTALKGDPALANIPVIVVSSLDDETGSVVRAIKLGAEDFLPKDFEPAILKARLDASLARKRFRDRELAYFRDVERLTQAAQVIEAGAFRPTELCIDTVAERRDPLGRLADVFRRLAEEIYERERRLDRTVRTLQGTLLVLAIGAIFGIAPALGRMAAGINAEPLGLVLWANITAAIVCLAIAVARSGWPRLGLGHLRFLVPWAIVLGCLYQLSTVVIAQHVEASMISLMGSSRGFMVFALAAFFALERPSLRRLFGLGLGFAAVATVLILRGAEPGDGDTIWLLASLLLPLLLAIHTLMMSWRPKELDAFAAVGVMMALSAVILGPVAETSGTFFWPSVEPGRLELIILVLGAASGIAVALALDLVTTAGAVFASQVAYSQTLAGIVWGMLLLGEELPIVAWAALALVVLGFWLVEPKRADEKFAATLRLARSRAARR